MVPEDILPRIKNIEAEEFHCPQPIESIYASLTDKTHTALLKTGKTAAEHRWSVIGMDPFLVFESKGENVVIHGIDIFRVKGNPFIYLQEIIDSYSNFDLPSNIPFPIGAIGAFSYDLKEILEDIPSLCTDTMGCCGIHFSFFKEWIAADEREGKFYKVRITTDSGGSPPGLAEEIKSGEVSLGELTSNFTEEGYKTAITKVRDYIKKGTIYQANISQQFKVEFQGDSFHLFEMLNKINPAPMSAYLNWGDCKLISSSPERFLLRKGQYVESKPVKGTRPRGRDADEDLKLKQELVGSEKDSAELAMIVDLVRNDLGRTAKPGTVRVQAPKVIEEYTNVFHSLAVVVSRLREGVNSLELIRSCFPGGSITGCPKVQAMKVIEEIEKNKRGFYCGSIGYIGFNGDFDLSIAIRTFVEKGNRLYFNLGGGIVYDSDPQEEYDETIHKGETMFQVLRETYAPVGNVVG
jgi:para-aminobenzoate synthetase component 1